MVDVDGVEVVQQDGDGKGAGHAHSVAHGCAGETSGAVDGQDVDHGGGHALGHGRGGAEGSSVSWQRGATWVERGLRLEGLEGWGVGSTGEGLGAAAGLGKRRRATHHGDKDQKRGGVDGAELGEVGDGAGGEGEPVEDSLGES